MEFRKSGFGDEDSANLALVATMYQNIADQEISAGDAASFIVSQMKAFGIESENATHIIDAVNEVSNNFAVSSTDVSTALTKTSAAMSVLGNNYEQTIGLVTAGTEILTGQGSKVAKGLRTIGNNFANAAKKGQDIEYSVGGVTKSLSLLDKTTGDLKPTFEIFKDLKEDWDNMTDAEKQSLGITYAGKTQFEVFAAVMENFEVALRATETAYDSLGSAAEENAKAMESLEGKTRNLKSAWKDFATNTITKDFIGSIIDAGTQLLTFANTDMGRAIAKALLFGTTIGAASGFIGTFGSSIGKAIANVSKLIPMFKAGEVGVAGLFGAFSKPTLTLFALGVAGVVAALVLLNEALGNSESAFDKYMSKAQDAAQKQQKYEDKLNETKDKLEELNKVPYADRTSEHQHEIEVLKDQIEQYEKLIELEKQRQSEALKKASDKAIGDGVKMGVKRYETTPFYSTSDIEVLSPEQREAVDALPETFGNDTEALDAYANALGVSWAKADGTIKTMEEMREELKLYGFGVADVTATLEDAAVDFQALADSINEGTKPTQKQLNLAKSYVDANKQIADSLSARINNGDKLSEDESRWLLTYNNLVNAYENGQAALDKYSVSVKTAQDALSQFPKAEQASRTAIETVAKALVNNSELGIQSAQQLKSALQNLAEGGVIDLSRIGNIDEFIQRLMEIEGFDFSSKTVDITTDDGDAIQGIDEVASELESIPENIVANISTTSDAETMTGALDNLNAAIDKLQGKSVDVTIGAKTDAAITALGDLKSQIESTTTDVDVNAVGNDMVTPMLNQIKSLADAIQKNIQITVRANISSALANLRTISNYTIPNKSFSVVCSGASVAIQNLATIKHGLDQLHDKTITVTVNYQKTGNYATGTESAPGGLALINDGAPVNGSAGELVVHDGVGQIYNDGKETVQPIPKGAKIYTARQTQDILKDRGLTVDDVAENPIPAMANGTNNNKYPDYRLDPTYSGVTTLAGSGEDLKKNFDEWLKEKKHFLNMDVITEAQYYRDLEIMNERYLKNMAEYRDDYWQHEEEIYNWRNQSLEEQIALEEKLEELAKAKTQKVLTYTGGRFQYLQNIEAIAAAQREVDKITGKYADGTMGARGGLSLVGEEGPELRVLKNGDGIIPADATKNLLSLSRFSAKDIIGAAKSNIMQYAFNISNLSLPNVHSPEDFIDGLRNMAYQYSFSRT